MVIYHIQNKMRIGGVRNEATQILGLERCFLHGDGYALRLPAQITKEESEMNLYGKAALFAGGVLFGSAGLKLLASKDAKKVYTHTLAAALRVKESAMGTVTAVQENAADILAAAEDINAKRAAQEAAVVEDTSAEG